MSWVGDHSPRHVHVYRDGTFVLKWDLERGQPMRGILRPGLEDLLKQLVEEGLL